ncbi:hypothetical protein Fcan01_11884 [Folsomia candida]|uniref:Uncharacterized protein n=1 Tax=Folsomia candida TaxID=158441 RepID=A0A226EA45_FOLCA|nr:hypothetical protein Fcan01_11884 [Folsomia candida]
MVFTPDKVSWGSKSPPVGPVISLVYDIALSLVTGYTILEKFSMSRRRNKSPHCWTTFAILPELAGLSKQKEYLKFVGLPIFIDKTSRSHYFILMTAVKHDIQREDFLDSFVFDYLCLAELILVDATQNDNSMLRFKYHNIYHLRKTLQWRMEYSVKYSEAWYTIECELPNCFDELVQVGKNVSLLNKYFWTLETISLSTFAILSNLIGQMDSHSVRYSRHANQRLAEVTSFQNFVNFLILQDVLSYGFVGKIPYHHLEQMFRYTFMHTFRSRGSVFVMYDIKKYSFVSCYGVKHNSTLLKELASPFDADIWTYAAIYFTTFIIIFTLMLRRDISDGFFVIVGLSLENSVSLSVYENSFRKKRSSMFGINALVIIWSIFVGTVLTNWYKTLFTMEMIIPTVYKSPWTGLMEVEGIRILMPFTPPGGVEVANIDDFSRYPFFYYQMLMLFDQVRNRNGNRKFDADKRIAAKLFKKLQSYLGLDDNLEPVRNGTSAPVINMSEFRNTLADFPIQPVEYDKDDSYGVIKSLQTCGKVALMDTKENIQEITNFLNDRRHKEIYVQVEGDSFFTGRQPDIRGWDLPPIRTDYVEKRLKIFISSGIMSHLKEIHRMWHPAKLLGHYANWTGPKGDTVSRLEFSSKVTTGFYLCGFAFIICAGVLFAEIVRYKYDKQYNSVNVID